MNDSQVMVVHKCSDGDSFILGVFLDVTEEQQRAHMLTQMTEEMVDEYEFDFEFIFTGATV
jgi:hypothetical protein